jgi:hypothetical protein
MQAPIIATNADGLVLPLLVTASRAGHLKQSLGPTMVVAARLEPLAVPISLRAEGNQVLADGQADLTGKQTGRGPRAESERAKQERLRRGSAAHLRATCEAKKMMMRSRLGDPLLRRDADTSEAKADAASKMALLTALERGAGAPDGAAGLLAHVTH